VIPESEVEDRQLPEIFINTYRRKGKIECQTLELMKLNQKITDAHNEVILMSDRSIQDLIDDVRTEVHPLFKVSESIAMLDMIASFAQLATTHDYVRPELTATLAIKAGRHPIRERIQREKYIPNDVYATQQNRLQIVTGCNMSGKSTYIRTVALVTVMAQIGCFVPAQYASFPITHQLFARISSDDSIEANVSTFAAEMRDIAFIFRNIERRSLVIVDELGRGTSTTDGLAVAVAIAEALLESRAYLFFVTHFRELARILGERSGVVNLHLAVDIPSNASRIKMLYRISNGYEQEKFYGLVLAKVIGLPEDIIETATEVSETLHERNEARKCNTAFLSIARRRKLVLSLREQLIQARDGLLEGAALRQWLKRLQNEMIVRMAAIDAEAAQAATEEDDLQSEPAASPEARVDASSG
jgi:DNA mismatch repair protein MSH4